MKKLILIMFLMILLLGSVSALNFDNVLKKVDKNNSKYPVLLIKDSFDLPFFGSTIVEMDLIENTDQCLVDCYSIINTTLYQDSAVFLELDFVNKKGKTKNLNYKLSYLNKYTEEKTYPTYAPNCSMQETINGTEEVCSPYINGTYKKYYPKEEWVKYNGQVMPKGSYLFKLQSKKNAHDSIDWSFGMLGISTGEVREYWAWWDSNWQYKKQINITENSGQTMNNYSVNMTILISDSMTGLDDIRFLDSTETVVLPHGVYFSNSSTIYAYVKVPLTASTTTPVYMYYGNAGASRSDDMQYAFLHYDNTTTDRTSEYSFYGSCNSLNYSNGFYKFEGVNSNDDCFAYVTGLTVTRAEVLAYINHTGNAYVRGLGLRNTAKNNGYKIQTISSAQYQIRKDSGTTLATQSSATITDGVLYPYLFRIYGNNINASVNGFIASATDGDYASGNAGIYLYDETGNKEYFTNLTIRQYTVPEPTYIIGSEEAGVIPPTVSLVSPANATESTSAGVTFNCSASDDVEIVNMSLYVENSTYLTNVSQTFSGSNVTSYQTGLTLNNGWYNWTCGATDNQGSSVNATPSRTLLVNVTGVAITQTEPADNLKTTDTTINFNCTGVDNSEVKNITLWIDGLKNYTEAGTGNPTLELFRNVAFADGVYSWTCSARDDGNILTWGTNRSLTIDTIAPTIVIEKPGDGDDWSFNVNTSIVNGNEELSSCVYDLNGAGNVSMVKFNATQWNASITVPVGGGNNGMVITCNDTVNLYDSALVNWTFTPTPPTITLTSPASNILYLRSNSTLRVNWTAVDPDNVSTCWYNYNSVNTTVNCSDTSSIFNYSFPYNNLTFYANDSFGGVGNLTTFWNVSVFEHNQVYSSSVVMGSLQNFYANVTLKDGISITSTTLVHNNTPITGENFIISENNNTMRKLNYVIPSLTASDNVSFHWVVNLSDGNTTNLTFFNQEVNILTLDNCTSNTNTILNFTLLDEETQNKLTVNTTMELAVNVLSFDRAFNVVNLSQSYNDTNPALVCLNIPINGTNQFSLDTIVRYIGQDRANEYYNIVNLTVDNDTTIQNINLYDLLTADSTEFQLTFKGTDFVVVEDALVYVKRQYIADNDFKIVELPKTDSNGQTILHLVRNDIVYTIQVTKGGAILGTFENIVPFCDDVSIGNCKIELNAFDTNIQTFDYDTALGITFTNPSYNNDTRVVSFNYLSADSSTKTVNLDVTRNDIFGNTSVCNDSITSTGGTLTCTIPSYIEDSTLLVAVSVDDNLILKDSVRLVSNGFGAGGYLLAFIFILAFALMFIDSKSAMLLGVGIGFISSIMLGLLNGKLIGLGASGLWLAIIIIIMLWKLNKERTN